MTLLTVREAAKRLGVGYSTLKHWIYEGRVRTRLTSGGHHRIADTEVDRLLAPSTKPPARKPVPHRTGAIVSISGRNQLRGYVDELKLRRGDEALAIVKATEVMVAREAALPREARNREPRRR